MMRVSSLPCRGLLARLMLPLALALPAAPACAQVKNFEPQVGQQGKDVIWVPTPDEIVERMLRMAQTTSNDYVVDLGSGDGRIAIAAAKGFAAKTGFLHSPTFGGGSWYAHSTLLTGLWIPDQNRYESVVSSNRLSLTR